MSCAFDAFLFDTTGNAGDLGLRRVYFEVLKVHIYAQAFRVPKFKMIDL